MRIFLLLLCVATTVAFAQPPGAKPWGVRVSATVNPAQNPNFSAHANPAAQFSFDDSNVLIPWTVPEGQCLAVSSGHLASKARGERASYCVLLNVTAAPSHQVGRTDEGGVRFDPPMFFLPGFLLHDMHLVNNTYPVPYQQTMICQWRGWVFPLAGASSCGEAWTLP